MSVDFSADFDSAVARACDSGVPAEELVLGCVVRLDRGFPAIVSRDAIFRAEFSTRLSKGLSSDQTRAAVGDWVCARRPDSHDMGRIEEVLPRRTDVARWKGGSRGERQTLAANVELVLLVQQVGSDVISCDRIVRSAVIASDCGTRFAVVLTKCDRASAQTLLADVERIRAVLGESVPIVLSSSEPSSPSIDAAVGSHRDELVLVGLDGVRGLVPAGVVAIVLGESGAGKSTLLNGLLGHDALETGAVRSSDDAGRHTTVARRMVRLPGAGIVVDEPGLRSLPVLGHERGLARVFPDVSAAAETCRFSDCTHVHEPGCGVRAALDADEVCQERHDAYVALATEMRASAGTLDPDIVL